MIIQIKKANIFEEVARITAYIGTKNNTYTDVALVDEQTEVLELPLYEACNMLSSVLQDFITEISPISTHITHGEVLDINLNVPNITVNASDAIPPLVKRFLIHYVVSEWLSICAQKESEGYASKAQSMLALIKRLIYYRKKIRYEED